MALGSFFSADPLGGVAEHPLSFQRYLYADADPLNHGDPSGKQTDLVELVAGLSIAAESEADGEQEHAPQNEADDTFKNAIEKAVEGALHGIAYLLNKSGAINHYFDSRLSIARACNPAGYSKIISKIYDVLSDVYRDLDSGGVIFFREYRGESKEESIVEREVGSNTVDIRVPSGNSVHRYTKFLEDVALGAVLFYLGRGSSQDDSVLDVGYIRPSDFEFAIALASVQHPTPEMRKL
jgi:hypothetical protein